jgi:hypothetical protein
MRSFKVSPRAGRGATPRSGQPQATVDVTVGVVLGARPIRPGGVEQIDEVRGHRGETGRPPGDARHTGPGGAVGAAGAGETRRRGGASRGARDEQCISNVRGTGGVTKI